MSNKIALIASKVFATQQSPYDFGALKDPNFDVIREQNAFLEKLQKNHYQRIFLDDTLSPQSLSLLRHLAPRIKSEWFYCLRQPSSESIFQIALAAGAHKVLVNPRSLHLHLYQESLHESAQHRPDQNEFSIGGIKARQISPQQNFSVRRPQWDKIPVNAAEENSFFGLESYQAKYTQILGAVSAEFEMANLSFVSFHRESKRTHVLASNAAYHSDIARETHAELSTSVDRKAPLVSFRQGSMMNAKISVPLGNSGPQSTSALVGTFLIDKDRYNQNHFLHYLEDLADFAPRFKRAVECLDFFSRIYAKSV